MKRVIIVQARMTSTRLPGKVLMEVAGRPMLAQQIRRLRHCKTADEIVVATTTNATDEPVVELARQEGVAVFRGSEHDVLGRFVACARQFQAEVVVRVTADCPMIDPEVTDRVVAELIGHSAECDYVSNVLERTYPQGLDVEALFLDTLFRADRLARSQVAREHVTLFVYSARPDLFICRSVTDSEKNADLRWTVDMPEDLQLVRMLYEALQMGHRFVPYREIVAYVRAHPELINLNAGIQTWQSPREKP